MELATLAIVFVAVLFIGSIIYGTKLIIDIEN